MNQLLKDKIYDVPQNILIYINNMLTKINGKHFYGIERAKQLVRDKKVTYSQLKEIIHDMKYLDKEKENMKYHLYGGDLMLKWSKDFLNNERDAVQHMKKSSERTNNIGGLDGVRKNNHNKTHEKSVIPILTDKNKKSTISSLVNNKLFEDINKIKKLITF